MTRIRGAGAAVSIRNRTDECMSGTAATFDQARTGFAKDMAGVFGEAD